MELRGGNDRALIRKPGYVEVTVMALWSPLQYIALQNPSADDTAPTISWHLIFARKWAII